MSWAHSRSPLRDTGRVMSQENVELVRTAFETFSAEDIDAALSFCSPDVVWYTTDRWLDGSAYSGHDGMRRLAAALPEHLDGFRFQVHEMRDAPDRVVACVDMIGRIKHSESEVTQRLGFVVSGFRDGTFREVRSFPSWSEALTAAGLDE
jgi:ketosteroid isomerase-like protein